MYRAHLSQAIKTTLSATASVALLAWSSAAVCQTASQSEPAVPPLERSGSSEAQTEQSSPAQELMPQPQSEPQPTPIAPSPRQTASRVSATYRQEFEAARNALLEERDQEAARRFDELADKAPTAEERRIAEEFESLARARLRAKREKAPQPHIRSADEMSVLYTTAFTYGFGTSTWVALQLEPQTFAAAVLPFIAITTASVGGVAVVDQYRPFRLGVPQAISSGVSIGFIEGLWLVGYQGAVASRSGRAEPWRARTVSTVLWSGATIGGIAGGVLGALREPTPGQTSLTSSAAIWGGLGAALFGGALQPDDDFRAETSFASGAIGYNVGLLGGLLLSPHMRPSIARMRLINLGGLAGGLVGVGGYLLAADDAASTRGGLTFAALGGLAGLGLSWWATDEMAEQRHPHEISELVSRLTPVVTPIHQGAMGGVALSF